MLYDVGATRREKIERDDFIRFFCLFPGVRYSTGWNTLAISSSLMVGFLGKKEEAGNLFFFKAF